MNEIQTFERRYMLTTFKGTNIIISDKQEDALKRLSSNKLINLNGITVNTSDIAEIMPLDVFYQHCPDKRPAPQAKPFTSEERVPYTKTKQISALESMLKGFSKCIADQGYPASPKQQALRDKINTALEKTKQLGDNEKTDFDIRKFI